jgi:AbiJ N-terminal domain 4
VSAKPGHKAAIPIAASPGLRSSTRLALARAGLVILENRRGTLFGQLLQAAFDTVHEAGAASVSSQESRFSRRYGDALAAEITIREDAPSGLRATLLDVAGRHLSPKSLRAIVCRAVHELPDRNNWSDSNVLEEAQRLVEQAAWPNVYDIIEMVYARLLEQGDQDGARAFEHEINAYCRQAGIGWQLIKGEIETRGPEAFEMTVRGAETKLAEAGLHTASEQIREALHDLSKRPEPDLTGALHHAMGALECVARESCANANLTLGGIVKSPRWGRSQSHAHVASGGLALGRGGRRDNAAPSNLGSAT